MHKCITNKQRWNYDGRETKHCFPLPSGENVTLYITKTTLSAIRQTWWGLRSFMEAGSQSLKICVYMILSKNRWKDTGT